MEGSKLVRVIWAVIPMVLALLTPTGIDAVDGGSPATTFFGSVTDIDTGDPIENATVYVRNYALHAFFWAQTDEEGAFSVQVWDGGSYEIGVTHDAYKAIFTGSNISKREDKRLDIEMDHYENNCNIMVLKNGRETPFYDAIVELDEDDPNGSFHSIRSDEQGWANITIPPGYYVMTVHAQHYQAAIRPIHIGEGDYIVEIVIIGPENVGSDASKILLDNEYTIPARSVFIMPIATEEDYSLYFHFRSDRRVSSYTVPCDYLEDFLNWTEFMPPEDVPIFLFDFAITEGLNAGISCSTWTDPYYIVIINNKSDPSNVEVTLKYDYGTFNLSEPSYVSIDEEDWNSLNTIVKIFNIINIMLLLIVLVFLGTPLIFSFIFWIRKDRKEIAARSSDPPYGGAIKRRSSRERDRSSPPNRWDRDRSGR